MMPQCPICKNDNSTIVYDQLQAITALIVKCDHCQHIYTVQKRQFTNEELYADEVYGVVENRNSIFDKILNWEYGRVIRTIDDIKRQKGQLLDFGSGKGKFASLARTRGWRVKCIETAAARADYAKNVYGLDVNTQYYTSGKLFAGGFDVLTCFHVLEHLPDPQSLLIELIQHNLAKDGLVVIEVPNIRSVQSLLAGRRWMHLDAQRHISHFTPAQLEKLARKTGLVCRQTSFFSFHLGVLGMTDAFLKLFGYRQNIIYQLKNKKSLALRAAIFILLPLAVVLEFSSAVFKRGGVVRKYFVMQP